MGGTEVFFNSAVGLEILIGYRKQTISIDNSPTSSYKSIQKALLVNIGFIFHLESK